MITEAEFEKIYRNNFGWVYKLCLRMLHHAEDAEDVAQQTFLQVWRSLDKLEFGERFNGYLKKAAMFEIGTFRNRQKWHGKSTKVWRDGAYRAKREPFHPDVSLDDEGNGIAQTLRISAAVHDAVEAKELFARMPKQKREVVVSYVLHGHTLEQIGDGRGVSKSQVHRWLTELRQGLQLEPLCN